MQHLIEDMIHRLTDRNVRVILDDELDALGETTCTPNSYVISVNVEAHIRGYHADDVLDQIHDTIRHEVAHVEHIASLYSKISAQANEEFTSYNIAAAKYNLKNYSFDRFFHAALRDIKHGKDSHHGPNWKKFARKLNATPKAAG